MTTYNGQVYRSPSGGHKNENSRHQAFGSDRPWPGIGYSRMGINHQTFEYSTKTSIDRAIIEKVKYAQINIHNDPELHAGQLGNVVNIVEGARIPNYKDVPSTTITQSKSTIGQIGHTITVTERNSR